MNNALVSIIIPAYNTAPYIHKAIDSSLRQTHKNIEVLIINDGSSDDTLEISEGYAQRDERVRVFSQDNAGVSSARNHGIRQALGEYIVFLDSDDWLEDNALEVMLDLQARYPDKLVGAGCYYVEGDGVIRKSCGNIRLPVLLSIQDIAESYAGIGNHPNEFHSIWAKIFRAEIIKKGIYFPEGIAFSEDAVFVVKYLYKAGGAAYTPQPVYNMYQRQDSATRQAYTDDMTRSQIEAYEILINLPENTPEIRKLMGISRNSYILSSVDLYMRCGMNGITKADIARIRNYVRPYAKEHLSCKKLSIKQKASFIIKMYSPLTLGRVIMSLWQRLRKVLYGR